VLYELRDYELVPGRMPDLVARFRDHTLALFAKHGLDVVFIGVTEFGDNSNNQLTYVLRFDSYQEMQERWTTFQRDPDWLQVRSESEVNGPLVARITRRLVNGAAFENRDRT
jgi:hypothetical protein